MNNTQINYARYLEIVMLMYNITEHVIIIRKHQDVYGNITEMNQMITKKILNHFH